MNSRLAVAILISAPLLLLHCGDQPPSPGTGLPPQLSEAEQRLVNSQNVFGLNLFRETVAAGEQDANVFISPLSVSMALGMTANGARGTTLEAMMNTLQFSGMTMHEMDSSYRGLIDLLTGLDPETVFSIANSIWYRDTRVFRQEFFDTCEYYFDASVQALDFSKDEAVDIMNAWVADKTHGKIEEVLEPPIPADVVMYLINAIYFLGTWMYEFDPALTEYAPFHLPDASTVTCELMMQPGPGEESDYLYYANDGFQAVDLPYGDGWYSMTVLLPRYGVDIDSLIGEFTQENWDAYMAGFEETTGRVFLPKFEIEYDLLMNDVLTNLGMGIAFTPAEADFTGMREEGQLWISRVIHKTYVKVYEEGTEAAAVTVVEMTESVSDSFEMRVDRPFIFAIREKHSGTILFMGKIVNPLE